MGNQLAHALADAGLVAKEKVEKQAQNEQKRSLQKEKRKQRKRHQETDEGRILNYSSPTDFLEDVRQRIKNEGYSAELMAKIFQEAHRFSDAKLARRQRGRLHKFLCELDEKLAETAPEKRQRILRDGKKAFKQMNAKKL